MGPWTLHAWWRLSLRALRRAKARAGPGARLLLRLHDPAGRAPGFPLALEVPALGGHWYVDFWQDGHALQAELGLADRWGGFQPLAASGPLALARAAPGPRGPVCFGRARPGGGVKITRVVYDHPGPTAQIPPAREERASPAEPTGQAPDPEPPLYLLGSSRPTSPTAEPGPPPAPDQVSHPVAARSAGAERLLPSELPSTPTGSGSG